jgi:hypothetical protein
MPGQFSARMRLPSGWESALQRHRRQAADELAEYLIHADMMRARIARSRILIASQGTSPSPAR